MTIVKRTEVVPDVIAKGHSRYMAYTQNLMVTVGEFTGGASAEQDPLHSHPHEQVSYLAAGEAILFIGYNKVSLKEGDLFAVPPNVPHTVHPLTPYVRIIDAFTPIRQEFLHE